MDFAGAPELLEFDRQALLAGDIWRLWTCHLVHYTLQHLLLDGAVVAIAGLIAAQRLGLRTVGKALAFGAPCIALGLLLAAPELHYYRGASGIAVMLTVMAGLSLWRDADGRARAVLMLMAVALPAKVVAEAAGWTRGWSDLPPDVAIAWQAHLLGCVAGVIAVAKARASGLKLD
jgi:rhomboid family GlyGly-CTERM serine protease